MPVLAMFLAAMLWSSSIIGSKLAVLELAITEVVAGRFLFAAAMMWGVVLLTRQPIHLGQARRPLLMGMLDPGLVSLFLVWGLHHTSAVNAAVFWALMPVIMPLAARLVLREAVNPAVVAGAVLAFAGAIVLMLANQASGEGNLFGDMLTICGVMCGVASALLARRVAQQQGRPMVTTAWQMTMALVVGSLALVLLEQPATSLEHVSRGPLGLLAYLGLIATAGPFFLLNYALRRMPVGQASLYSSLVGPLSVPLAVLVLGETMQAMELAAIAIVMLGVFLPSLIERVDFSRFQRRPQMAEDPPLASLSFVVFDTETTGLHPSDGDRIVQIAGVRIVDGIIRRDQIFNELVHPGRSIPAASTKFHGIIDQHVADKRSIGPVLRDFHGFCGDSVLVAHNAAFDMRFLELAQSDGAPAFIQPVLDTLLLSAVLEPDAKGHDLDALVDRHDARLPEADRHTALGDSLATAEVFLTLLTLAKDAKTLGQLINLSYKARRFRRLQKRY
ncbi:MAG: EamA family transporter [Proteobacteria bacterium]|nr:EamA family transporter [Pseudomonadota bacterium]